MLERRRYKLEEQEQLIPLINEIRSDHPRMSARDIYYKLQPSCMGRDKFERFCMDSGYRIKQLKNYRVTTNSLGVTRFNNLIKDIKVTRVNQVFVSDITYYDMGFPGGQRAVAAVCHAGSLDCGRFLQCRFLPPSIS